MWNLPAPPEFRGLDEHKDVKIYVRHLPHWRQDGATYFVTFRLHDSLPESKLRELRAMRREWERANRPPHSQEALQDLSYRVMRRVEHWLDQGMGECLLREPRWAEMATAAMHRFDGARYELDAYVVMPNHVHAVVRPFMPGRYTLEHALQGWKAVSARRINAARGTAGPIWQDESFDRIIRDEEHLWRAIQYIGRNPAKAGLRPEECRLWLRPAWSELGWRFDP
jgi:REP element-mobilizing transposase RayT